MSVELAAIAGVFIGSISDRFTALMLIGIWTIIRNPQLPTFMGGKYPQELISDITMMLYGLLLNLLFKRNPVQNTPISSVQGETLSQVGRSTEITDIPSPPSTSTSKMTDVIQQVISQCATVTPSVNSQPVINFRLPLTQLMPINK